MIHKPIQICHLNLSFPHKTCINDFSVQINYGSRIAIIGNNGSGKTSILKMLLGTFEPTQGKVIIPKDVVFGYVPQIIEDHLSLSGGQRLNQALTEALSADPNVLLLDEPTNHLDLHNRNSLMRMLCSYRGTLIVVSHDPEFCRRGVDTLWHIDQEEINVFTGGFDDYMSETHLKRASILNELAFLEHRKKEMHHALMKEQRRAANSKKNGEKKVANKRWLPSVARQKASRGEETTGKNIAAISGKKQELIDQLSKLRHPETITPKFSLDAAGTSNRAVLSITEGALGYNSQESIYQI